MPKLEPVPVGDAPAQQQMMGGGGASAQSPEEASAKKADLSPEEASGAAARREALQLLLLGDVTTAPARGTSASPKDARNEMQGSLDIPALPASSSAPSSVGEDVVPSLKQATSSSSPRAIRSSPRSPEKDEAKVDAMFSMALSDAHTSVT